MTIVAFLELGDDATDFLDGFQDAAMDDLLLDCAVEAFGGTVGLARLLPRLLAPSPRA